MSLFLPRAEYRRGQTVEVQVRVDDGVDATSLRVGLVCTETYWRSRAQDSPYMASVSEWEEWRGLSGPDLSFAIPADAPYSHAGKVLSIDWAVAVKQPRRLRRDLAVSEPIWVDP